MSFYRVGTTTAAAAARTGKGLGGRAFKNLARGSERRALTGGRAGNIQHAVGRGQEELSRGLNRTAAWIQDHPEPVGVAVVGAGAGAAYVGGKKAKRKLEPVVRTKLNRKSNVNKSAFGIEHVEKAAMPKVPNLSALKPKIAGVGAKVGNTTTSMGSKVGRAGGPRTPSASPMVNHARGAQNAVAGGLQNAGAKMSSNGFKTGAATLGAGSLFAAGGLHSVFGPKKNKQPMAKSAFGIDHE